MSLVAQVRDHVRTSLKIRRKRTVTQRGRRPNPGARIARGELRMTVQAGMTAELWRWLQDLGWREILHKPDRRHYRDLPSPCFARLIECAPEERSAVLARYART
jgi:O-methyltransferase involved in polyketide biosynthesis